MEFALGGKSGEMKRIALASLFVVLAACSKKTEEPVSSEAVEAKPLLPLAPPVSALPSAAGDSATQALPGDMAWDVPSGWSVAPNPSTMRKATYKIAKAKGDPEDAEMSVSQAGGAIDANTDRWSHQFKDAPTPKTDARTVGGLRVTIVEIKGTWNGSGMPGAAAAPPKDHYMMLSAIVETDPAHFFKMVGPEKTVTAARADFEKMIASFRMK